MRDVGIKDVNPENIKAFIQGNWRMLTDDLGKYYNIKFFRLPLYKKEQILYRKHTCPDCLQLGHCQACKCSVPGKWFADSHCKGDRYPDLMNAAEWEEFKTKNNIVIDVTEDL